MDKTSRIVILCESYPSIAYPLYRLTNEKINTPVTIFITALKDLYQLFQLINEKVFNNSLEVIYYPRYTRKRNEAAGIKKLLYTLPDIFRERRHLKRFYDKHFTQMKDADILFPSPGYSGAKIYVLRRLSKRNRLIFIDPGPPYMGRYFPRNLRDIVTLLIYKIVYGKETQLGQYPSVNPWDKGFPLMPNRFMENSVASIIDWSNRDRIMEGLAWDRFRLLDTGEIKVIYFHQDLVGKYVPDRDTFSKELNDVFNVILRHFPEKEIARKYHPGHEHNKDVIEIGGELPVYIPAEFLYNEKVQIYLGISSNAIVNVRGGQAISLIDLITFKSNEVREGLKERLIRTSHKQILFPFSLEELEKMIIQISGKNPKEPRV